MKPSAWLNVVTLPLPLPSGYAAGPRSVSIKLTSLKIAASPVGVDTKRQRRLQRFTRRALTAAKHPNERVRQTRET